MSNAMDPGKVKQQLYEALIITNVLIDFMVGIENVTSSANSTQPKSRAIFITVFCP